MLVSRQRRTVFQAVTGRDLSQKGVIMADLRNYQARATPGVRADAAIDEGLRAYMIRVYNLMALGLAITGLAAFGAFNLAIADGRSRLSASSSMPAPSAGLSFLHRLRWCFS